MELDDDFRIRTGAVLSVDVQLSRVAHAAGRHTRVDAVDRRRARRDDHSDVDVARVSPVHARRAHLVPARIELARCRESRRNARRRSIRRQVPERSSTHTAQRNGRHQQRDSIFR